MSGPRWAGVPVSFESGTRIAPGPLKRMVVTSRHRQPCLCGGTTRLDNRVVFTLEPDDTISISFWAKRPRFDYKVEERAVDFALDEKSGKLQSVDGYARLLHDAVRGDQTSFVSTSEVLTMWRFVDPVIEGWPDDTVPLETYAPDTHEPVERARAALGRAGAKPQIGVLGARQDGNRHRARPPGPRMAGRGLEPHDRGRPGDGTGRAGSRGLADPLEVGDIVTAGGNSRFTSDEPRAERLRDRGIGFLHCGTSGGPSGARHGACLMIGDDREMFRRAKAGRGILTDAPPERDLDLEAIADVYQHAGVIEPRLVGWLRDACARYGDDLGPVSGNVGHTAEGAWTVEIPQLAGLDVPVIEPAPRFRLDPADLPFYTSKIVQPLRNEFGGHGPGT